VGFFCVFVFLFSDVGVVEHPKVDLGFTCDSFKKVFKVFSKHQQNGNRLLRQLKSDNISSQKFPHLKTFAVKKTRNLQQNIPFGAWGP
jgi:hypothetical protein